MNELLQASHVGLSANLERAVGAMSEMITTARTAELERRRTEERQHDLTPPHASDGNHASEVEAETAGLGSNTTTRDTIYATLLDVLCCVMVADGRASRSERACIRELMKKVGSSWNKEDVDGRIVVFIDDVRSNGYRKVLSETLSRVSVFKQTGREDLLCRCIDTLAAADGTLHDRERKLCDRIKHMVS